MVKETMQAVYPCEKCGKRGLYKADLTAHEKNCGIGVKVKVGDKVLVSRGYGQIDTAEVVNITGKTLIVKYPGTNNTSTQLPSEAVRIYDTKVAAEIRQFFHESHQLNSQSEAKNQKALELFRAQPSAWG